MLCGVFLVYFVECAESTEKFALVMERLHMDGGKASGGSAADGTGGDCGSDAHGVTHLNAVESCMQWHASDVGVAMASLAAMHALTLRAPGHGTERTSVRTCVAVQSVFIFCGNMPTFKLSSFTYCLLSYPFTCIPLHTLLFNCFFHCSPSS